MTQEQQDQITKLYFALLNIEYDLLKLAVGSVNLKNTETVDMMRTKLQDLLDVSIEHEKYELSAKVRDTMEELNEKVQSA